MVRYRRRSSGLFHMRIIKYVYATRYVRFLIPLADFL